MAGLKPAAEETRKFATEAAVVLARVRAAFAALVDSLPGDHSNASELQRTLGTRANLSWRAFKIASATTPLEIAPYVPGRANFRALASAAARRGIPDQVIQATLKAGEDFEQVVASHAGDRATFDSMVSALAGQESAEQTDLVHRRAVFRGLRHILGVQAKTQLKLIALQPSEDPMLVDVVTVAGIIDLRRLRGDARMTISYSGARNDDGSPMRMRREPLEPVAGSHGLSLLRDFCSEPLPEFRGFEVGQGFVTGELVAHDVGNRAAVTCIEGHATPAALPRYRDAENRISSLLVPARTPCEVLVFDLLLHKDMYGPIEPTAFVYAEHTREMAWDTAIQNRYRLPFSPTVDYLGRGPSVLHTGDVPRYAELGSHVFKQTGWDGGQFDVYRCRIGYPIVPSSVQMRFDLPEAPAE